MEREEKERRADLQRQELDYIEQARGISRVMEQWSMSQEQTAKIIGKSQSSVANKLRLLRHSPEVLSAIREAGLTERHARALLPLEREEVMLKAAQTIIEQQLSVRQTEALVKQLQKAPVDKPEKTPDIYVEQLERDMSSLTAHRITIKHGAKKGKITIEYYGNEDLEAVCEALKGIRTDKTAE